MKLEKHSTTLIQYVVGFSGGKDSTATLIYLIKELGLMPIATFQDTGNEAKVTYDYIDYVSTLLKEWTGRGVVKIKGDYDFLSLAKKKKMFPGRLSRFCTQWLKIIPNLRWLESQPFANTCIMVSGIRSEESLARSKRQWFEPLSTFGRPVWHPILDWAVVDVFNIHKKYGVDINPLYKQGAKRVGCFPCVNAGRDDLLFLSKNYPERIKELRQWEHDVGRTYFRPRKKDKITGRGIVWTLDEHIAWAKKTQDGQMELGTIKDDSKICAYADLGLCE